MKLFQIGSHILAYSNSCINPICFPLSSLSCRICEAAALHEAEERRGGDRDARQDEHHQGAEERKKQQIRSLMQSKVLIDICLFQIWNLKTNWID